MDEIENIEGPELDEKKFVIQFCSRQQVPARIFIWLHLIRPTAAYYLEHPITHRLEAWIQVFDSPSWVFRLLQKITGWLIDDKGRERRDRLIQCNWISENEKYKAL